MDIKYAARVEVFHLTKQGQQLQKNGFNSVTFLNKGNKGAYINSVPISPGDSLEIAHHDIRVRDLTEYSVKFDDSVAPPPAFTGDYTYNSPHIVAIVTFIDQR